MSPGEQKVKVLQVVTSLNRGGIETWLAQVLRHVDRDRVAMDFLVHTREQCALAPVVEELGARVLRNPVRPSNLLALVKGFRRCVERCGPYDAVHFHMHWFCAPLLYVAKRSGIPVRVAHSHTDHASKLAMARMPRRVGFMLARTLILRNLTHGLGCSNLAGSSYFGDAWYSDARLGLALCGIDLGPFVTPIDKRQVRSELGVEDASMVIGHVGGFSEPKNYPFILRMFAALVQRNPTAKLLLVGDGPLRQRIGSQVISEGLKDRVAFAGVRGDVPRVMMGAMDVFVLPSLREGMPLAAVEAQAAGLPCFLSDCIAAETDVVPRLVERISLECAPEYWADRIVRRSDVSRHGNAESVAVVAVSDFNIANSARRVCEIYLGAPTTGNSARES